MALPFDVNKEIHPQKLQTCEFGLGLLKKWNIRIGLFPQTQEILVGRLGLGRLPGVAKGAGQLEPGGRTDRVGQQESTMIEHLPSHSWRRDCTGSTRMARRAGPNAAASATAAIENTAATITTGSRELA